MKSYLAMLTAVTLLGAGCAAPATPAATPSTNAIQAAADPEPRCDALLTLAEAQQVSGLAYAVRDAKATTMGTTVVTTCTFYTNERTTGIKPFTILTRSAASTAEVNEIFEASKTATYADGQPISGLGDQALWSPSFRQLSVLQGRTWLIVSGYIPQEILTKIAQTILPKLR